MTQDDIAPRPAEVTPDEKTWGLVVHLSALSGIVLPIPFANIIVPLIIWHIKKGEMPFIDDQGREVLNFQITAAIAMIISAVLMIVVIGFLLLPAVMITALVLTIIAAIRAHSGEAYRYPFSIRFLP